MSLNNTQAAIAKVCDEIKALLLAKNEAYGDSAIDPVRIYSKSDPAEQINVRIDDKLSRILRGKSAGEDVDLDLMGYLVLKRIAQQKASASNAASDYYYFGEGTGNPNEVIQEGDELEIQGEWFRSMGIGKTPIKTLYRRRIQPVQNVAPVDWQPGQPDSQDEIPY